MRYSELIVATDFTGQTKRLQEKNAHADHADQADNTTRETSQRGKSAWFLIGDSGACARSASVIRLIRAARSASDDTIRVRMQSFWNAELLSRQDPVLVTASDNPESIPDGALARSVGWVIREAQRL